MTRATLRRSSAWLLCAATALAASAASAASAQGAPKEYQSSPPRRSVAERDWGPWLGPFRAQLVPSLMEDFGERYLYAEDNRRLAAPRPGERRVVFLGDSITDKWDLAASFPGKPYVNRGIGSQVTAQMVLRFHQDVIALHPAAVVILAGVNDVQGFLQHETLEQVEANYEAMAEMASAHGIRVVFGSVLPVHGYTPEAVNVPAERDPAKLRALNAWLADYCRRKGHVFADYWPALADGRGLLRAELSRDGVHPLPAGYTRMAPVTQAAIARALRR